MSERPSDAALERAIEQVRQTLRRMYAGDLVDLPLDKLVDRLAEAEVAASADLAFGRRIHAQRHLTLAAALAVVAAASITRKNSLTD